MKVAMNRLNLSKRFTMSTKELRRRLIEKIELTDDDNLLEEASRLLEVGLDDNAMYILNATQHKAIDEARKQFDEGASLTNEEANKEIGEWLSK